MKKADKEKAEKSKKNLIKQKKLIKAQIKIGLKSKEYCGELYNINKYKFIKLLAKKKMKKRS